MNGNVCDACTLIVIRQSNQVDDKSDIDYTTLLLERSSKSSFMPNACVFPGGKVDPADFSDEWKDFISKHLNWEQVTRSLPKSCLPRSFNFTKSRKSSVPADIGLRICAIRETFEESGVLLLRKISHRVNSIQDEQCCNLASVCNLSVQELQKWRHLVRNNAYNFLKLCKHLNLAPDCWSLYEWSNWITPKRLPKRFDTIFFICCTRDKVYAAHDELEVVQSCWNTPIHALKRHVEKDHFLPPPQLYELSRLCNYDTVSELLHFSCHRAMDFPTLPWLPILLPCSNGALSLLPGDSLYPKYKQQHGNDDLKANSTMIIDELRASSKYLNRLEYRRNEQDRKMSLTFVVALDDALLYGHKRPYLAWQNSLDGYAKL